MDAVVSDGLLVAQEGFSVDLKSICCSVIACCMAECIFCTQLFRNYKLYDFETWRASAVWYEDDAHVLLI